MKLTLNDVTNIDALSVINDNFDKIEQELQNKVLYRNNPSGEPNSISNDIDMNGNDLLNVGDVVSVNGRWATINEVEDIRDQVEADAATVAADKALTLGYRNTAQTAATDAQTAYDNFDDRYLGAKTADPSVDNDGNALLTGALYYRTSGTPIMRVYNGTTWQDVGSITTTTTNLIDPSLYSSQAEAEAGVNNTKVITPLSAKQAITKQVKEGFTATGPIVLPGNASTALQAAPKQQVESVALSTVETYRGADLRISQLIPGSNQDEGSSTMLVKLADGRIVSWGRTTSGLTGTGNTDDTSTKPAFCRFLPGIPSGVTVSGFSRGSADSYVWLSNGWVYHSGYNSRGAGGHGDTNRRYVFTRIAYFYTNALSIVKAVAGSARGDDSYSNAYFLTSTGDVYFTGYTDRGMSAQGSTSFTSVTTPVKCLTVANIADISTPGDGLGQVHAWKADGTCYTWGHQPNGECGAGSTSDISTPVIVSGVSVLKVSSRMSYNSGGNRYGFSLFLQQDGTVKASGYNGSGQLGDGTATTRTSPVAVSGLANIVSVGASGGDWGWSWAVDSSQNLWMWGFNSHGNLGIGSTVSQTSPTKPVGWYDVDDTLYATGDAPFQGKVVKVVTSSGSVASGPIGRATTFVLDSDGNVWLSGYNDCLGVGYNDAAQILRFKKFSLEAVDPGDRVVDIRWQGHSHLTLNRLFAITERGKLLVCGGNNYDLITLTPGSSATAYRAVFLQPLRLGV